MGLNDMAKGNHILCFSKVNKLFRHRMNSILLVHVKLPHNSFHLQVTSAQQKKSNGTFGLKYEYLDLDISPDPLNPGYQNKKPCLVSILGSKMQVKQILL